jgi:signal transduction histidine kinase/DNA-binding response OmpR family regulator
VEPSILERESPPRQASAPRRKLRPSLRWLLAGLVAIVIGVMAAAVTLQSRVIGSVEELQNLARESTAEEAAARTLLNAVRDAETGQRGYLLTLRPSYLQPYWTAVADYEHILDDLDRLAQDAPWLRQPANELRLLAQQKMAEMAQTIEVARSQGQQPAIAIVMTDHGKATMDGIRSVVAGIIDRTAAEHERRLVLLHRQQVFAGRSALATVALGVLLLGVAVAVLLVNRRSLLRANAAAREQWQRLEGTVAHMRDGVALFDAKGRLLLFSPSFFPVTGLPAELAQADAGFERFAVAAADWPGAPLAGAFPEHDARVSEVVLKDRVLELWRRRMPDGGQLLAAADITRRVQAEAIARQAQKLESLGQLTGGVAHDFNNLLQVVSANLEMVAQKLEGDRRLAAAVGAVERAARLTRHLLAFARRQPLAPQDVDTARLLGAFEDVLHRTLGETVQLELVLGGGLWPVRADPQQLENAILNLAINARDAMPEGGRLTIEASNRFLDDDYAAANAEVSPGQYVMFAITDTGVGMTPEVLARAGEPFFTTKPPGQSTGLGLSMVFGFAKQSGGHFKLYSETGRGTTARLYIPRSQTAPNGAPVELQDVEPAHGELVLVVEDDATVRASATEALRSLGYRTLEAASAGAALELLRAGNRPDILFTDVVMPGRPTARELAEEARRLASPLAVVFTSGYTANAIVHNGQLDPGVTLISKPWRIGELARRLRAALSEARQPRRRRALRVLLVEDDPLVRMTTADLLADLGHEVLEAATGEAAVQTLRSAVDLVITDFGLPDMDGLALTARLRERYPEMPVIIATGHQARAVPGVLWLEKPYDQAALRRTLAQALGTGGAGAGENGSGT